jgi:hypothetical protein
MVDHLVIPDTQIRPGLRKSQLRHLPALANYINFHMPEKVVILGDWWDMPSLSSYDKAGGKSAEGRRIQQDIDAGNRAMDTLLDSITYEPRVIFLKGNHEDRLDRLVKEDVRFEGVFDDALSLSRLEVVDFLTPINVDGINYCHYFYNQYSGRALAGTALSQLKNLGFSFTAGHKQILDVARLARNNGTTVQGLVAGAFYLHDEEYKGCQGNHHWRGIIHKWNVRAGTYDLETIRIESLIKEYS